MYAKLYTRWTVLLVGDGLSDDELARAREMLARSSVPRSKWVLLNLPPGDSESTMHTLTNPYLGWMSGGTAAMNYALEVIQQLRARRPADQLGMSQDEARSLLQGTHLVHVDSDDKFTPSHLSLLAEAYSRFDNVSYAFTQAEFYPKGIYPPTKVLETLRAGRVEGLPLQPSDPLPHDLLDHLVQNRLARDGPSDARIDRAAAAPSAPRKAGARAAHAPTARSHEL